MSTTISSIMTIASLPVEIHSQILRSLPCFRDLHSAILASRLFHNAWVDSQNSIINAVARETIQPWEHLVRLYLASQQKFEVSADEVANHRLTLHAITYIYKRIDRAELRYKAMLSRTSRMRDPHIGEGPKLPPREPCPLELNLFARTYHAMSLIRAYPPSLRAPLFSRIATMDLLRIRQLQRFLSPGDGGGDTGRQVHREFMRRLPHGSGVLEGMAERALGGEPFALWLEAQERVRWIERVMREGVLPWHTGVGVVEIMQGAGGVEWFNAVSSDGGHGGIMGLYRWQ